MFFLFGLLAGLAIGAIFHFCRTREMRRAIKAAIAQCETLSGRLTRADNTLTNLHAIAARMQNSDLDLGGKTLLPVAAESEGQRSLYPLTRVTAGLSHKGQPRLLGRE